MYYHSREKFKKKAKLNHTDPSCKFCGNITSEQFLRETEHCLLIRNRVPYEIWEHHNVLEHLLVVPKRHVENLGDLTEAELRDAMKLCFEYEAQGFGIYARGSGNPRRTAPGHQHTHLIKIGDKLAKFGVYNAKPYLHVKF